MDAMTAIVTRHSTREYLDRPVPKQIVEQIVDAGRRAPTARNEQPWEFVAITDPQTKGRIAELTDHGKFLARVPVCLAVFCRDVKYYLEDGAAATQNMLLAATALGVQSCWVAGDKKPFCAEVARMLGVPAGCRLVSLIGLGYEAAAGRQATRRELKDVLHWERY